MDTSTAMVPPEPNGRSGADAGASGDDLIAQRIAAALAAERPKLRQEAFSDVQGFIDKRFAKVDQALQGLGAMQQQLNSLNGTLTAQQEAELPEEERQARMQGRAIQELQRQHQVAQAQWSYWYQEAQVKEQAADNGIRWSDPRLDKRDDLKSNPAMWAAEMSKQIYALSAQDQIASLQAQNQTRETIERRRQSEESQARQTDAENARRATQAQRMDLASPNNAQISALEQYNQLMAQGRVKEAIRLAATMKKQVERGGVRTADQFQV